MRARTLAIAIGASALVVATLAGALVLVATGRRLPAFPSAPGADGGYAGGKTVPYQLTAQAMLGPVRLTYPAAMARAGDGRKGGALDTLDLMATLPDFRAPVAPRPGLLQPALIFIALRPQEATLDPAERPVQLYAPFLSPEIRSEAGGLQMRRFGPGSPYGRENLYIVPPEGRAFSARCSRPADPPDGLPETCISDMRLKGLDVQVRFSPAQLPEWESIQAGVARLVEEMAK